MQHHPRGLVGADLQGALQAQRRDAVLAAGEQPASLKPHRQRRSCPIEDRSRCRRGAGPAPDTLESAVTQPPSSSTATGGADEPVRPAKPLQVVQAVRIRAEPRLHLTERPRVVNTSTGLRHPISLAPVTWRARTSVIPKIFGILSIVLMFVALLLAFIGIAGDYELRSCSETFRDYTPPSSRRMGRSYSYHSCASPSS